MVSINKKNLFVLVRHETKEQAEMEGDVVVEDYIHPSTPSLTNPLDLCNCGSGLVSVQCGGTAYCTLG